MNTTADQPQYELTTDAAAILDQLEARACARSANLPDSLPEMLIWTLLRWEKKVAVTALESLGIDCYDLQKTIDEILRNRELATPINHPAAAARLWVQKEADLLRASYIGTEHVLLAALSHAGPRLRAALASFGIDYGSAKRAIEAFLGTRSGEG